MKTLNKLNHKRIIIAALFLITGLLVAITIHTFGKAERYANAKKSVEVIQKVRKEVVREAHIHQVTSESPETLLEKSERVTATVSVKSRPVMMESPIFDVVENKDEKDPDSEDADKEEDVQDEETLGNEDDSEGAAEQEDFDSDDADDQDDADYEEDTEYEEDTDYEDEVYPEEADQDVAEQAAKEAAIAAKKKAKAEAAAKAAEQQQEEEIQDQQEEEVPEQPEEVPEETEQPEEEVPEENGDYYSSSELAFLGEIYSGDYRWTWYSQNVLPGEGLTIPGRHVDESGYVCDENDRICLASNDLEYGTVVDTPFGKEGCVYDSGCDSGTLDVYVDF